MVNQKYARLVVGAFVLWLVSMGCVTLASQAAHVAVIDRIVDGEWVVFLVGPDRRERSVPMSVLYNLTPMGALAEGTWGHLEITERSGHLSAVRFTVDATLTEQARIRAESKRKVLRAREAVTQANAPADANGPFWP